MREVACAEGQGEGKFGIVSCDVDPGFQLQEGDLRDDVDCGGWSVCFGEPLDRDQSCFGVGFRQEEFDLEEGEVGLEFVVWSWTRGELRQEVGCTGQIVPKLSVDRPRHVIREAYLSMRCRAFRRPRKNE